MLPSHKISKKYIHGKKAVSAHPNGNQTTCNSGNATICMIAPFFERPSSVVERNKKSIDGLHSVPEPNKNTFMLENKKMKRSETPQKKIGIRQLGNRLIADERASSKEGLKKYERYTELSSLLNSQANSASKKKKGSAR